MDDGSVPAIDGDRARLGRAIEKRRAELRKELPAARKQVKAAESKLAAAEKAEKVALNSILDYQPTLEF